MSTPRRKISDGSGKHPAPEKAAEEKAAPKKKRDAKASAAADDTDPAKES